MTHVVEADERYDRLLAVTRRMAEDGYDAVSMRAVARKAQMSLATIYQYVGSKDELIAEAHAGGMRRFSGDIVRRPPRDRSVEARVRKVLRALSDPLTNDPVRTRTLMRALYSGDPATGRGLSSAADSFREAIHAAIGDEELVDRDAVVETLGLVLHGIILGWLSGDYDGAGASRALENAATLVFQGCLGRGSAS